MAPLKSYLVQAVRQWAVDQGLTPQILVDANVEGCRIPMEYCDDGGKITLNIHPEATGHFDCGEALLTVTLRFSGQSRQLEIPYDAVLTVFARENGQGLVFPDTAGDTPPPSTPDDTPPPPTLKLVK